MWRIEIQNFVCNMGMSVLYCKEKRDWVKFPIIHKAKSLLQFEAIFYALRLSLTFIS